jgi:hypothetical protein
VGAGFVLTAHPDFQSTIKKPANLAGFAKEACQGRGGGQTIDSTAMNSIKMMTKRLIVLKSFFAGEKAGF